MPIYAYKCSACGMSKDILRKISDAPLTTCPACGQETLAKQVTAAGFQLKGSGWYVTDFRGGDSKTSSQATPDKAGTSADSGANGGQTAPKLADSAPAAVPASVPAPAPAPTSSSGGTT